MNKATAQKIIRENLEAYNKIASHYSNTRRIVHRDLEELCSLASKNEKILDSGCGDGRLFPIFAKLNIQYTGLDFSHELIKIAQNNYPQGNFVFGDFIKTDFPKASFDKIFSISVMHHIPSKELHLSYLKEQFRLLKPKGKLIGRIWKLWQRKNIFSLFFKKFISNKEKGLEFFDIFLPWKNSESKIITQRFIHCFRQKEIEKLLKKSGFEIEKIWQNEQNYYFIAKKPRLPLA